MFRSVSLVTACGLTAQLVGLVRLFIVSAVFGLSPELDAYYLALALPAFLTVVAANWVQLVYLGRYTALRAGDQVLLAAALRRRVFQILLVGASIVTLALAAFAEPVLGLALAPEQATTGAQALPLLALSILPMVSADFMGQTLNGHHRFGLAALAPLVNTATATGLLWLAPEKTVIVLIWSLLAGAGLQLLVVAPAYLRLALPPVGTHDTLANELRAVLARSAPIVPAVVCSNALLAVMQFGVARFGEGYVTAVAWANHINSGLVQLLVIGFGTVLLPYFATRLGRGDHAGLEAAFRRLARGSACACALMLAGLYAFAEPVLTLVLERGAFDATATRLVSTLLLLFGTALLPLAMGTFIARYFSAAGRTDLVAWSGFVGLAATVFGVTMALNTGDARLIGLTPLAQFTATLTFWLLALNRIHSVRSMLADLLRGLMRAGIILLPLLLLDAQLSRHLPIGELEGLLVRITVMFVLVVVGVLLTGTHRWIAGSRETEGS